MLTTLGDLAKIALNPSTSLPEGDSGVQFLYGSLGRLEAKWTYQWSQAGTAWQRTCGNAATPCTSGSPPPPDASSFTYDAPFTSTGGYTFTAGRLASEGNGLMQIAYGYDADGRVTRRDESFQGV